MLKNRSIATFSHRQSQIMTFCQETTPSHGVTTMSHSLPARCSIPPFYVIGVGIVGEAQEDNAYKAYCEMYFKGVFHPYKEVIDMKKKIMAVLATIAAVLGFGFAANTALAVDTHYGATGNVDGNTVVFTFTGLAKNTDYTVSGDDAVVQDIQQVISRTFKSDDNGTLKVKFILKAGVAAGTKVNATLSDASGKVLTTATATVPATGNGSATTADTGASVAPYAVAVVLLAAAGVALFAVRKTSVR